MKIYVAGCGGMLGGAVYSELSSGNEVSCSDKDVNAQWLSFCDFRDHKHYRQSVEAFQPDVLIHLGAHTDLEYCERNPGDAYETNTTSVESACQIANSLKIPLVFISTAGVFDGSKLVFDDDDKPNPLGVYARSKTLAEEIVRKRVQQHFIFRAGWMMGGGSKDKKFVGKLIRQIQSGATTMHIVDDRMGTPTYTADFARNLSAMLPTDHYGTFNMVCGGETSRLEVAKELVSTLGLTGKLEILSVPSSYFADYWAPRPTSERLINRKLNDLGLNLMRDWRSALHEYVANSWQDDQLALVQPSIAHI